MQRNNNTEHAYRYLLVPTPIAHVQYFIIFLGNSSLLLLSLATTIPLTIN